MRRRKGWGLVVLGIDPAPDPSVARLAQDVKVADLADIDALIAHARRFRPHGICTFAADYPVVAAASLCEHAGLPGLSLEGARCSTDKSRMRRTLRQAGIPVPLSIEVTARADLAGALDALSDDIVVKPVDSSGGRGVTRLISPDPRSLAEAHARAIECSSRGAVVVEDYVDGPEYSVETISIDGDVNVLAITTKTTSGSPYFVELAHEQPSDLSEQQIRHVADVAVASARALRIDTGPSHCEIRWTVDGPVVIEVAARCGGGFIASDLVPLSTGIDLPRACLQVALGDKPDVRPSRCRGAAVRFLEPKPGTVTAVSGVESAKALPGVTTVELGLSVGDRVHPFRDARDRIGHVIAEGKNAAEAAARCLAAVTSIDIITTSECSG